MKEIRQEFTKFFEIMHGFKPYPYQYRLMESFIKGNYPKTLSIPTGLGKSYIVTIFIFTLYKRPDITPRRLIFVSDRQLYCHNVGVLSHKILNRLKNSNNILIREIREKLNEISGDELLYIDTTPGGIPLYSNTYPLPNTPYITILNEYTFMSRVLFCNNVNGRLNSIYGALYGNDCLVILDDIKEPNTITNTLQNISNISQQIRYHVIAMSSMDGNCDIKPDDLKIEKIHQTIHAKKPIKVISCDKTSLNDTIHSIIAKYPVGRICVMLNDIQTAMKFYKTIRNRNSCIITGRMRPFDAKRANIRSRIVVCTSCIEVGPDMNFDIMITEICDVKSLCNRFGRLNRYGDTENNHGYIICNEVTDEKTKQLYDRIKNIKDGGILTWLKYNTDKETRINNIFTKQHLEYTCQSNNNLNIIPYVYGKEKTPNV